MADAISSTVNLGGVKVVRENGKLTINNSTTNRVELLHDRLISNGTVTLTVAGVKDQVKIPENEIKDVFYTGGNQVEDLKIEVPGSNLHMNLKGGDDKVDNIWAKDVRLSVDGGKKTVYAEGMERFEINGQTSNSTITVGRARSGRWVIGNLQGNENVINVPHVSAVSAKIDGSKNKLIMAQASVANVTVNGNDNLVVIGAQDPSTKFCVGGQGKLVFNGNGNHADIKALFRREGGETEKEPKGTTPFRYLITSATTKVPNEVQLKAFWEGITEKDKTTLIKALDQKLRKGTIDINGGIDGMFPFSLDGVDRDPIVTMYERP